MSIPSAAVRRTLAILFVLAGCHGEEPERAPGTSHDGYPVPGSAGRVVVGTPTDPVASPPGRALEEALSRAQPGVELRLPRGTYVVDNPLRLDVPGLLLRGEADGSTMLRPRNPGRAVIEVHANEVAIENVAVNAAASSDDGRATFAILYEGCAGCRLVGVTITGTGASAVWGGEMRDFRAERNVVLDTGDDAFFLGGREIRLVDNIVIRFGDEAVDIGESSNVILRGNCLASGRMAIAITADRAIVNDNVLEDLIWDGFFLHSSDGKAVVTGNDVRRAGSSGLLLVSPGFVSRNRVAGPGRVGLRIERMDGGLIQENVAMDVDTAFLLRDVSQSSILLNRYSGEERVVFLHHEGDGTGSDIRANRVEAGARSESERIGSAVERSPSRIPGSTLFASRGVYPGECLGRLTPGSTRLLTASLRTRLASPPEVTATTERDRRIAARLNELWARNNPGFLALEVDGTLLTTEVTSELLGTLQSAPERTIGLVRMPMMLFGRAHDSYGVEWRLTRDGVHVATVRYIPESPGASIFFE